MTSWQLLLLIWGVGAVAAYPAPHACRDATPITEGAR